MPDEMNFIRPRDVDAFGFDWGRLALTVGPEVNGAKQFSGGVVDLPSGQGHTRHNHPGAEEIIFVISGEGEQMVEDPDGKPVTVKVGPGTTVFVPESRFHSTLNTGPGPMFVGRAGVAEIGLRRQMSRLAPCFAVARLTESDEVLIRNHETLRTTGKTLAANA